MQVQEELEGPETCRMECCWCSQMYATDCTPEIRAAHTDTHTYNTVNKYYNIASHTSTVAELPRFCFCRQRFAAANPHHLVQLDGHEAGYTRL